MPGVTYLACDPVKRLDSEREAATIHSVNQERSAGARAAPGPGRSGRWRKVEPWSELNGGFCANSACWPRLQQGRPRPPTLR